MKKTTLVTGGAGYIGSHTAAALLEAGEQVVVLDDLSTGSKELVPSGAIFVQGDVGDISLVHDVITAHNVDAILHFAGSIDVAESVRDPKKYFENNTEKTRRLVDVAIASGVSYFVFSSTAAVYGGGGFVNEDAPTRPQSPYGESKLQAEQFIRGRSGQTFHSAILRYFNVAGADPKGRFGYRRDAAHTHLIRRAIDVARGKEKSLPIFGTDYPTKDGTGVRDYIHVSDLADAHVLALQYLRNGGESQVFNCGYGRGFSVREVVQAVERATGNPLPVFEEPRRLGDIGEIVADATRIRKTFGWMPRYDDLNVMIQHTLAWVSKS